MAVSKKNMEKLAYLFDDAHKVDFIQTFIQITDKSGKTIPFLLEFPHFFLQAHLTYPQI